METNSNHETVAWAGYCNQDTWCEFFFSYLAVLEQITGLVPKDSTVTTLLYLSLPCFSFFLSSIVYLDWSLFEARTVMQNLARVSNFTGDQSMFAMIILIFYIIPFPWNFSRFHLQSPQRSKTRKLNHDFFSFWTLFWLNSFWLCSHASYCGHLTLLVTTNQFKPIWVGKWTISERESPHKGATADVEGIGYIHIKYNTALQTSTGAASPGARQVPIWRHHW